VNPKNTNKIKKIRHFALKQLNDVRAFHTQNVAAIALKLAEAEKADKEIIEAAAWLHDIGYSDKRAKVITHHIYSVKMAKTLLKKLKFEQGKIEKILDCIREHLPDPQYFKKELKAEGKDEKFLPRPSSKEAKILFDSDMMDLCSPSGAVKIIVLKTREGKTIKEAVAIAKQLTASAVSDIKTKTGKKMAEERFKVTRKFLEKMA
jgi:putative nucleotidyltransferase with HDIG domain